MPVSLTAQTAGRKKMGEVQTGSRVVTLVERLNLAHSG
jgi:hypothetical protein